MLTVLSNFGDMLVGHFELALITGVSNKYSTTQIDTCYTTHTFNEKKRLSQLRFPYHSLKEYLKENSADIIINVAHPYPIGLAVAVLASKHGIKSVIRITGDIFNERFLAKNPWHRLWKILFYERIMLRILRKADRVLPIGRGIEKGFLSRGFPAEKLVRIAQPFRLNLFENKDGLEKNELKKSLGLATDKKTLLFVGRLTWGKGIDRIIEMMDKLRQEHFDFQFCFVGDGPFLQVLEELGHEDIILTGRLDRKEIPVYYQAADLFVYPTRTDGLPNVVIEAIAAGLPVVSTPIGEIPYLTKNYFESPAQITEYILKQNYTADEAHSWFNWENQKNSYLSIFSNL